MKGSTLHIEDGKSTPAKGLGPERAPLATTRLSFVADLAAIAVIVIGFAAQFGAMRSRYLSPDEAFNLSFAGGRDLMDAYQGSKATPHPPLFFLLMHFWMRLGRSELFLRSLSAFFGAAFLWFLYRWSLRLFGRTAGFVALLFGVFSPALLPLSSEVRGYSLFLLLSAAGLAAFEIAVDSDSPAGMAASFLLLWLAILSHYGALFIVLALAVYAPFRLRKRRSSRKVVAFWAAGQVGAWFLCLFLYLSHVKTLLGGGQAQEGMTGWLGGGYFRRGQESALWFLVRQSADVFRYFFGPPSVAIAASLAALAGVVLLAVKRRPSVFLLALPLFFGAAAGLADAYPFVGSRHSIYLLPFVLAAIGVAFSAAAGGRLWAAVGVSAVLVPFLWTPPASAEPQSLARMNAALEQLYQRAPAGSLILSDFQTGTVLRYYFNRDGMSSYRLVRSPMWAPDPLEFGVEIERMVRVHHLSAGQRFWVIGIGSVPDAGQDLMRRFPNAAFLPAWRSGEIWILEVRL